MTTKLPPDLHIPPSSSIVQLSIIDTTSTISLPTHLVLTPPITGHETFTFPSYAFLITQPSTARSRSRSLLFDLGVRKDWSNLAPCVISSMDKLGMSAKVSRDVRDILESQNFDVESIEAIVWSHWHWDHVGDPSRFPKSAKLIVGPGFKENIMPGWPEREEAPIRKSDYDGREVREVDFQGEGKCKIGRFDAIDYFGDGSFYLLDAPGHAIGHMCGLARVTAGEHGEENEFVFMGGDACHQSGEFRPSPYMPFPESISPCPLDVNSGESCPGSLFEHLLRDRDRTKPFYSFTHDFAADVEETENTIQKVMEIDAQDRVLVVIAHDASLLDVVDFYPKYVSNLQKRDWKQKGRWLFLKDFAAAVEKQRQ